jgi:protein-disulfide isomerase
MRLDQMVPGTLKVPISEHDHVVGPPNAPGELVEYGDYECRFCGKTYPVVERIREEFAERLRFVFRHFPLSKAHPKARLAAQAAEAAARQGQDKFWAMHHRLYTHQDQLSREDLFGHARELGLDADRFAADLDSPAVLERIESDFRNGVRSGVNGTPTFFINARRMNLPPDYDSLKRGIEKALATRA